MKKNLNRMIKVNSNFINNNYLNCLILKIFLKKIKKKHKIIIIIKVIN